MTAPPRRIRALLATMRALQRLRLMPDNQRSLNQPAAKRMAVKSPAFLVGAYPEVPHRDVTVTTRDGHPMRVRVYEPAGATAPVLYAHGGGFSFGGIDACDHICRRLADESGFVVVSVEYRLAPEHRFPTPLDDCEDAVDWLLAQSWDTNRLVVAGDSAGGNLAAALSLRLRSRGVPTAGQLLIYPALDMTVSGAGAADYRGVGLSTADLHLCAATYLGTGDPTDPLASPLLADDVTGLAPALVVVAEHDPLRDEGVAFAERLSAAGVPARLIELDGHVHGSLSIPAWYRGVDEVYAAMSTFVRDPSAAGA